MPGAVWALCLFVLPFSFAIAVLKDVPDGEGDRAFRIATFTIRLGARRAAWLGLGALGLAYAGMAIAGPLALPEANASGSVLGKVGMRRTGEVMDPEDGLVWRWECGER